MGLPETLTEIPTSFSSTTAAPTSGLADVGAHATVDSPSGEPDGGLLRLRHLVVIDYYQVPTEKPEAWPSIVTNDVFPAKLVYGQMHDYLRKVSRHVTIGRAYKKDRETPNCFTLCREG